jgi:hypothetical protein
MAQYTYVLQDLVSGTIKDEVPLRSVYYGHVLNGPGGFSGSIDRRHPKATRTNLSPGNTALYALRNGVCTWGGIIWTVRSNGDGLNIGAEGFWSYFRRRRLNRTYNWLAVSKGGSGAVDPLYIARAFIDYAQDPVLSPGGDIGVVTGSELMGTTVERAWFHYEKKRIGDIIEALTDNEDKFDFAIDVSYDTATNTFTKTLALHAPKRGSRMQRVWEIGVHCTLSEYVLDGTRQANQVWGIGEGEGEAMVIAKAADTSQLGAYPLLEDAFVAKDIKNKTLLAGMCNERLERRKYPVAIPGIDLLDTPETEVGSFITGDEIRVTGGDGFTSFDTYMRIDSFTVNVSDEGKEQVDVEFLEQATDDDDEDTG